MKKIYETPQIEINQIEIYCETLPVSNAEVGGDQALTKDRPAVDFSKDDNSFEF